MKQQMRLPQRVAAHFVHVGAWTKFKKLIAQVIRSRGIRIAWRIITNPFIVLPVIFAMAWHHVATVFDGSIWAIVTTAYLLRFAREQLCAAVQALLAMLKIIRHGLIGLSRILGAVYRWLAEFLKNLPGD